MNSKMRMKEVHNLYQFLLSLKENHSLLFLTRFIREYDGHNHFFYLLYSLVLKLKHLGSCSEGIRPLLRGQRWSSNYHFWFLQSLSLLIMIRYTPYQMYRHSFKISGQSGIKMFSGDPMSMKDKNEKNLFSVCLCFQLKFVYRDYCKNLIERKTRERNTSLTVLTDENIPLSKEGRAKKSSKKRG